MTSLEDFQKYEALKQELKDFLVKKCIEQEQAAKGDDVETYFYDDYQEFLVRTDVIIVFFKHLECNGRQCYTKHLPCDIVFDPDFKTKMKKEFDEAKEKTKKQLEEIERDKAERGKRFEIARLKELMAKYPDVVKEGV